jgi:hypothetical protein
MRDLKFILISNGILFILSCNQADMKAKYVVQHVHLEEIKDDVEPPPLDLKPTFKTVEEWLISICNSEKPKNNISRYSIGLFESKDNYILFLVGMNITKNREKVDFRPGNMYFLISDAESKKLEREQFISKMLMQLKSFTKTKKFEDSFLAKSNSIVFDNTVIWTR